MITAFWAAALLAAVPPGLEFEAWFTQRGVSVEIARRPGPIPWVRGTGELPVPAEKVEAVISDFAGYRKLMAPAVEKAVVIEAGERTARLHMVWDYPFPLRDRDAVVRYRGERLEEGGFRLIWRDEARPGDPSGGVRIEKVAGETRVDPLGPGRCRVTYTYLGDLGGSFPRSVEEKAWRHEPLGYFYALRRALGLPQPSR
ncbi:MAG: START domain-containing protein [Thermoanaerobaculia bacterium]